MIITCGGQKGGSGKSCLAQNLAVALAKAGKPVMLIDADPQNTSSDWADERAKTDAQEIEHQAMSKNLANTVLTLAETGRYLVIDCGGRDTVELRSAMAASDLLLVPVRPKRRDLKTLPHVADMVEMAKSSNPYLLVRSVISQAPTLPSQIQRIVDAKAVCESFGFPALEPVIFTRNVYDDAEEAGLSVFEADDKKAQAEIQQVCDAVLAIGETFFNDDNQE